MAVGLLLLNEAKYVILKLKYFITNQPNIHLKTEYQNLELLFPLFLLNTLDVAVYAR